MKENITYYRIRCIECNNSFLLTDLQKYKRNEVVSSLFCPRCESGDFEIDLIDKTKAINTKLDQFIEVIK